MIPADIAHRQEHAVAVIAREYNRLRVDHAYETRRAPLIRAGRITAMIDSGQKKHVARFNKGLCLIRKEWPNNRLLDPVSQPHRIELFLQRPLGFSIDYAHVYS